MGRAQKLEPGLTHITVRGANMISIAMPLSRRARVAVRGACSAREGTCRAFSGVWSENGVRHVSGQDIFQGGDGTWPVSFFANSVR